MSRSIRRCGIYDLGACHYKAAVKIDNVTETNSTVALWERLHRQSRFLPRYPHEQVVRWAFRQFAPSATTAPRILDHGCGAGRHALFLAAEGFDVSACDVSRPAVAELQARAAARKLSVDARVASDLDGYATARFDGVLSFGVLYYMTYAMAVESLRAVHRILKPGGRFLCVIRSDADGRRVGATPTSSPCTWKLEALDADAPSDAEAGIEMLFFGQADVEGLFSQFGNVVIDRMTYRHGTFADDDWVISAVKVE